VGVRMGINLHGALFDGNFPRTVVRFRGMTMEAGMTMESNDTRFPVAGMTRVGANAEMGANANSLALRDISQPHGIVQI
jgi:hypothetical protein